MLSKKIPLKYIAWAVSILCAAALATYLILCIPGGKQAEPETRASDDRKESLSLFLPSSKGGLEKKPYEIRAGLSERARADIIFQELRKGKAIPPTTKLHELAFGEDGVLYLDVSRGLIEEQLDAAGEMRVVYSLVNSFIASLKDINRVQLLVEGRPPYTLHGVVYTYAPLPFNKDLQEEIDAGS